jgi:hypothetical protein
VRRRVALHVALAGAYLVVALALTYPVVLHPRSTMPIAHQIPDWRPGDGDPWQALWAIWSRWKTLRLDYCVDTCARVATWPLEPPLVGRELRIPIEKSLLTKLHNTKSDGRTGTQTCISSL